MVGPIIEELATEYEGKVLVGKMNVDENNDVPVQYSVRNIPTILFIKGGEGGRARSRSTNQSLPTSSHRKVTLTKTPLLP